jgi:hypothetical protein
MHPRGEGRFQENELDDRWQSELHHNALVNQINQDFLADKE